jgi:hypothetical protein
VVAHLARRRSQHARIEGNVSNIVKEDAGDGLTRVKFHVKIPVAWASKTSLPETYEFLLPKRADYQGQESFTSKYKEDCVDWGAHDVDAGSMWYYYRPRASGCRLEDADVVKITAAARKSAENSSGKYPEYDKVWADGRFDAVAVFSKAVSGATSNSDAGIAAYNSFVAAVKAKYPTATTAPASFPTTPGVAAPDITFTVTIAGVGTVQIVALLIDKVSSTSSTWENRFKTLTPGADLIAYAGDAEYGSAVLQLPDKMRFVAGKYQVFLFSTSNSYAWLNGRLASLRSFYNANDPTGSKFMETITNASPVPYASQAGNAMTVVSALADRFAPKRYSTILHGMAAAEVPLVAGEQDNTFVPPSAPPPNGN